MSDYKLTAGLEVHAELKTRTKMFCDSRNDPDEERPNTNICPVCMGYPGTLPVINKAAVLSILRLGKAVGGEIADYAEFDRKNYFYPDIPKGYQISQYKHPLVSGGELAGIKLTRIHLEEDTAKSIHPADGGASDKGEESLVDFNRAGVPLMELVTEPVIGSSEEAVKFAKELQLLLLYLGISDANMEKGEMRIEANISVAKSSKLGTKVEVKNLNSFRSVGKAIEFEFERQKEILEKGDPRLGGARKVTQETRGWDDNEGNTFSQRAKEESHDYRYFPDPDLPKIFINEVTEFSKGELISSLPELPWQKRGRLLKLGIPKEHVEIYITQPERGNYFENVQKIISDQKLLVLASNYITSEIKKFVDPISFSETIGMIEAGEISSKGAKEILKVLQAEGGNPRTITAEKNLTQISDEKILRTIATDVLRENRDAPLQFLVGQAISKTAGRANPVIINKLLLEMMNNSGTNINKPK